MKCYSCAKQKNKETCATCREVLKIDLVLAILQLDPIYLSESNRNKTGRKPKLTADAMNDIRWKYNYDGQSMGKLSEQYRVSKSTISNIIHKNNQGN